MELDELLGIDHSDPVQQLAEKLVEADNRLIDDLVELRKSKGLTQVQVATRLGVDQSAIARIESGDRDPHLSTLRRYALAIGADVEHQVTRSDTVRKPDPTAPAVAAWAHSHGQHLNREWLRPGADLVRPLVR